MVPEKRVKCTETKAAKCRKGDRLDVNVDERKLRLLKCSFRCLASNNIEKLSPVERISIGHK